MLVICRSGDDVVCCRDCLVSVRVERKVGKIIFSSDSTNAGMLLDLLG